MIRLKLNADLEGLQGLNGELNQSKKNMQASLSEKVKETAQYASEMAKLR